MSAWFHLCKKEFRLGLPALLIALAAYGLILVLAVLFSWRSGHTADAIFIGSLICIFPHFFYLVFYMIISLQREKKKLHLWLANPMPGYQLILAKLINSIVAMTISLVIILSVCFMTFSMLKIPYDDIINWSNIIRLGFLTIVHIYLFAIDFAIWFIFFWIFYRVLVRRIGVLLSVIATIVLFGFIIYLLLKFESTGLYNILTHWGGMSVQSFFTGLALTHDEVRPAADFHVYLGSYLFEAVLCAILFYLSSWMLDRKVEV